MNTTKQRSARRVPISEPALKLACAFAAGDCMTPLPRVEADWHDVFAAVSRNGLLGLTHRHLEALRAAEYPPPEFRQQVERACRAAVIPMTLMYEQIRRVLGKLGNLHIEYLVLKGPALAYLVYPDPSLRRFGDLDIAIRERAWVAAHRALLELDFVPEDDLLAPPPKLVPAAVLYERKYRHPKTGFLVEVHYEDMLNAGLASRDIEGFWRRSIPMNLAGLSARTLSLEDQLIHLCAHAHFHGYIRLNWFSDLAFIVRDHAVELNWSRLLETVRAEEAQVATYYSLRYLGKLLGVYAPERVMQAVKPDRFRRWAHEHYLPETQVLAWQPMVRSDFSFYFVPLLSRLLPDLLVMGRRKEKLRYLLRLLVPPRAWLRYYYRLGSSSPIALQYLAHPLKLGFHYAVEVRRSIGDRLSKRLRPSKQARRR